MCFALNNVLYEIIHKINKAKRSLTQKFEVGLVDTAKKTTLLNLVVKNFANLPLSITSNASVPFSFALISKEQKILS